uniref:Putative terminase n=1 Tax=viral metagenome TaxID=1070528 RepID=A0A6H1ZM74_9ZZZZ
MRKTIPAKKKPAKKAKATRKPIDWDAIEREYRAGQFSNVEIGKRFNASEGAIRKKAKAEGWKKDLAEKVRKQVREKLVRSEVREPNASDKEIVEETAERGAAIIKLHRKDVQKSQQLVQLFQGQLEEAATKRDDIEDEIFKETASGEEDGKPDIKRRNMMLKAVSLPAHAGVLRDLTVAQKNLIYLERQAYNLDDDKEKAGDALTSLMERIAGTGPPIPAGDDG